MERRDCSVAKRVEAYLGADLNPLGATVSVNVMDNEAAPAFVVDQGLYCPPATGYYGYYCTGYQAAGDWDNHSRALQVDNQDLQYSALQAEGLPYVYYPPNYGYAQSAYNPFNPYIPGAIIGMDGQFVGSQPYYGSTSYQHAVSSSSYSPIVFQPSSDIRTCSLPPNSLLSVPISSSSGLDGAGGIYATPASVATVTISDGPLKPKREGEKQGTSIQNLKPIDIKSVPVASKVATCAVPSSSISKVNASDGHSSHSSEAGRVGLHHAVSVQKLQPEHVKPGISEGAVRQLTSPEMFSATSTSQSSSAPATIQVKDYIPLRRLTPVQRPVNITVTTGVNGVVDVGSGHHGWPMNDKSSKPLHFGMAMINVDRSPDALSEQNRGPRTSRSKNQWTSPLSLRVYSTRPFSNDMKENILIYADHYNRDDFPVSYPDAKFFVIKSYSEDDVHKSIKYNVWSSTPNGNKRLDASYADAQRRSGGKHRACPVFLFFSVNASGQFCGVAEMIGAVDFQKDMDFWQQDKWNGSFPVKWHLIKDVPNPHFRHIILENNENKPVTNSRDTQEVKYSQGIEMLKIFKSYSSKTSILDDFMYYEERQQALYDKKTKYQNQSYKDLNLDMSMTNSKLVGTADLQTSQVLPQTANDANEATMTVPVEDVDNMLSTVKISSVASEPEEKHSNVSSDIVTVGSMPIKVNGYNSVFSSSADKAKGSDDNLSILTVGTISIDPKALRLGKHGSFAAGNRSTSGV